MNWRYLADRTLGWMANNKMIVFLGLLSFCLFVSTLALAGQRNRLTQELEELKVSLENPTTTTEATTTISSVNPEGEGDGQAGTDEGGQEGDGQGGTDENGQEGNGQEGADGDGQEGTDGDGQEDENQEDQGVENQDAQNQNIVKQATIDDDLLKQSKLYQILSAPAA